MGIAPVAVVVVCLLRVHRGPPVAALADAGASWSVWNTSSALWQFQRPRRTHEGVQVGPLGGLLEQCRSWRGTPGPTDGGIWGRGKRAIRCPALTQQS